MTAAEKLPEVPEATVTLDINELLKEFHVADHSTVRALASVGFANDFDNWIPRKEFNALVQWCSHFYPYQLDWLLDPSLFAICCKSRQIGMSHTSAALAIVWGAYLGQTTTIVSKNDETAMETLRLAKLHARLLQDFGSSFAAMNGTDNKHEIQLASGGRVIAKPSDGPRGYTGNIILDEFGYVKHPIELWDAALPSAMLGDFKVRIISTPNGVGNLFHDTWEKASNSDLLLKVNGDILDVQWSPHHIPLSVAKSQGFRVNQSKLYALSNGDPRLYDQLFNCAFLDAILQYLPNSLIEACANDPSPCPLDGDHFAGLDIGKEIDLSVLVVLRVKGEKRWVVHVEVIRRTDGDALDAMVDEAFRRYKLKRLCIDKNGLGEFPAQRIKKKYSEAIDVDHRRPIVELNNFGLKDKENIATAMHVAMNDHMLVLPASDAQLMYYEWKDKNGILHKVNEPGIAKQLKRECAAIQRIVTRANNIRYDAPRTAEGHADRFWGMGLANFAVDTVHPLIKALQQRTGKTS